jgi:hypothetical protein
VARIPILEVQASTDGAEKCHGKLLEQICDFQRLTGQRSSARLFVSHHFMASNHTLPTDRRIRGQCHFGVVAVSLASGRGRDLRKPSRHCHEHLISIPRAHEADNVLSRSPFVTNGRNSPSWRP